MAKVKPNAEDYLRSFAGLPSKVSNLLRAESDRGAILVLAAYLDELLGLLIRALCVDDASADSMLQLRGPAGDFEGRVIVCEALGLIHPEDQQGLRLVQRIRNKAAHFDRSGRGFDVLFDSAATASQVRAFAEHMGVPLRSSDATHLRAQFLIAGRKLSGRLIERLALLPRLTKPMSANEQAAEGRRLAAQLPFGARFVEAEAAIQAGNSAPVFALTVEVAAFITAQEFGSTSVAMSLCLRSALNELLEIGLANGCLPATQDPEKESA